MSSAAESSRPLGMNLDFTDWTTGSTNQLWPQETCFFFIIICLSLFFSLYSFLKYGQRDLSKARSTKDTARRRGLKDSNHMKIIQRRKCQKKKRWGHLKEGYFEDKKQQRVCGCRSLSMEGGWGPASSDPHTWQLMILYHIRPCQTM